MRDVSSQIKTMRNWIRRNRHKSWNSDDLMLRIIRNWPSLSDEECEKVFQECWPQQL